MEKSAISEKILEMLKGGPLTRANLTARLKRKNFTVSQVELETSLKELLESGRIFKAGREYCLFDDKVARGRAKRDRNMNYNVLTASGDRWFVFDEDGKGAMDGDEVIVMKLPRQGSYGRDRHVILAVETRKTNRILGTIEKSRKRKRFVPDQMMPFTISVDLQREDLTAGSRVCLEIEKYPTCSYDDIKCKVLQVLGKEGDKGMEILSILYEQGAKEFFPEAVLQEAAAAPVTVSEADRAGRVDYRDLLTVTIDGDSSKDFDDAISVEPTAEGWRLYVHIADVAHYVREGSALDAEACDRGTSIYAADRVVPMLPFELSNGICSLNPGEDRLAMTAIMDFDQAGHCLRHHLEQTVIRSNKRCTYSQVNRLLQGEQVEGYEEVRKMLCDFSDLAHRMKQRSQDRGCIEFETIEPVFEFSAEGVPVGVAAHEHGWAEEMIEQAMIAANVAVAQTLREKEVPGLFRVHPGPMAAKLEKFAETLEAFHVQYPFNLEDMTPGDLKAMLAGVAAEDERKILNVCALRAMSKAVYQAECKGHYGLALADYCHFTSPIRRYPDTIVHRMLKKYYFGAGSPKAKAADQTKVEKMGLSQTVCEVKAVEAERAVNSMLMAWYASDHVGELCTATVTGVSGFGFFVGAPNGMEGLVHQSSLSGRWMCDERAHRFYCLDDPQVISLGDQVQVRIVAGDRAARKVTFVLEPPQAEA